MATYEKYMNAARNADAAGDEAAARQLVQAAMSARSQTTQEPKVEQLIPLPTEETDELTPTHWDYIYEPEAQELLEGLMTRYIESLIYHAVIENSACEQAAKMLAMKNATENAGDLIKELELLYNNVRQAAITQELSEIVGGAAAV